MRRSVIILFALAAFGTADIGVANSQVSDQCNAYPNSRGCPRYVPGQGDRDPRIGQTYPWEGRGGGGYRHDDQTPRSLRGGYQDNDQTPRSLRGGRNNDLNYLCSLGSQTPRSVRHLC